MTWAELRDLIANSRGCYRAEVAGAYPATADIWDAAPVTVAVYMFPAGDAWILQATAIQADGVGRCNVAAQFSRDDDALRALHAATRAVYNGESKEGTP